MKETAAEMEKQSAQMKQQMEAMPPAVREKMEQMLGGMADSVTVTKGGTRKVAGYDCQEYMIAMGAVHEDEHLQHHGPGLSHPRGRSAPLHVLRLRHRHEPHGQGLREAARRR